MTALAAELPPPLLGVGMARLAGFVERSIPPVAV